MGIAKKYRDDGKCGSGWPAPGTSEAICANVGDQGFCCSVENSCGASEKHCEGVNHSPDDQHEDSIHVLIAGDDFVRGTCMEL